MSKIKILGLALVAVLAMSAVAASPSFATFKKEWEVFANAAWHPVGAGEVFNVNSMTLLETSGLELVAEGLSTVVVHCPGTDTGTVESAGKDKVLTITPGTCTSTSCSSPTAKAVNLNWTTKLVEVSGKLRDELTPGTGGNPGWEVDCVLTETCTAPKATTAVENLTEGFGVTFDAETENASCNGLDKTGKVRGMITFTIAPGQTFGGHAITNVRAS